MDSSEPTAEAGQFATTPPSHASVGVTWRYEPIASSDEVTAAPIEILEAPATMSLDDDGLSYTPTDADVGDHVVRLAASGGSLRYEQTFVVHVAGRRLLARSRVSAAGGTIAVEAPETEIDGLEIIVPPREGAEDATVDVYLVEGEAPPMARELTPVSSEFYVESDLPDDVAVTARLPLASLRAVAGDDGLFMTAYPSRHVHFSGGEADEAAPTAIETDGGGFIDWTIRRVRHGRIEHTYRVARGPDVAVVRDQFRIVYLLDPDQSRAGVRERLQELAGVLVTARDYLTGSGCRFRDKQLVVVRAIEDLGVTSRADASIDLQKAHFDGAPRTEWTTTAAHELVHVMQFIAMGGAFPGVSEKWWIESTATYGADEAIDLNNFAHMSTWTESVSARGFGHFIWSIYGYPLVAFWKSVDAQHGGFDVCTMASEYTMRGSGFAALSSMLGGDEATLRTHATFVAAWTFVRTESVLEDVDVFFPPAAATAEFVSTVSAHTEDGVDVHEWTRSVDAPPGGYSARFERADASGSVIVQVVSPTRGFVGLVHSATHELLGTLGEDAPRLDLGVVDGDFYVTIALRQDGAFAWSADHDGEIDVRATSDGVRECAAEGGPCSGSGPAFDDECCEGAICVVGACREAVGARERGPCETRGDCAAGLACSPQSSVSGVTTCCARDGDYCAAKADCCGYQECTGNRCVGRQVGESCALGDCVGASFCSAGRCA